MTDINDALTAIGVGGLVLLAMYLGRWWLGIGGV